MTLCVAASVIYSLAALALCVAASRPEVRSSPSFFLAPPRELLDFFCFFTADACSANGLRTSFFKASVSAIAGALRFFEMAESSLVATSTSPVALLLSLLLGFPSFDFLASFPFSPLPAFGVVFTASAASEPAFGFFPFLVLALGPWSAASSTSSDLPFSDSKRASKGS